jgi:hypothetical protein
MISVNSEMIAGIAILMLGVIFLIAGHLDRAWALIFMADYLIIALGVVTLGIGFWTLRNERKNPVHTEHH